jgi:hypothetical protein
MGGLLQKRQQGHVLLIPSSEDVAAAWSRFQAAGLKAFTDENATCCCAMQRSLLLPQDAPVPLEKKSGCC